MQLRNGELPAKEKDVAVEKLVEAAERNVEWMEQMVRSSEG